jgi:glutamine amidotransferase
MIAVLDYGLGNVGSLLNAFEKLGIAAIKTANPELLINADGLIFPGDGAAGAAMENLEKRKLINPLINFIKSGKPFLGICLGMQILLTSSAEGNTKCLNIIPGQVKKFNNGLKIPQIGWNQIRIKNKELGIKNKLFRNISDKSYFYFINSYYCVPDDKEIITGITDYGEDFCSIFLKNNICGVQFHPEKSGRSGFQLLLNYFQNIYDN